MIVKGAVIMRKIVIIIISLLLLLSALNFGTSNPTLNSDSTSETDYSFDSSVIDNAQEQQILQNMNRLDGFFTENQGQVRNDSVRYYIQGKGVWFLDDGVVFEIKEPVRENEIQQDPFDRFHPEHKHEMVQPRKSSVLRLNFEGCNEVQLKGVELLSHRSNFFYGNDSSKWCTNVPNYQEVIYENIYDNIDLRYYSSEKGLKYDFIVNSGGDPSDIILSYQGAKDLKVDEKNNLFIATNFGNIIDSELFIYQDSVNNKNKINGKFKLIDSETFRFEILNEYDQNKVLIIDPLIYSTYVGGNDLDYGYDITIDNEFNGYITGTTLSSNFPNTTASYDPTFNGGFDIFVIGLNFSSPSLIFSTFIGGSNYDYGYGITVNDTKNVILTGYTESPNFPTTPNAYDDTKNGSIDGYIVEINSIGSNLLYSTYIGGNGQDKCTSIIIQNNTNICVTGITMSLNFPTTIGAYNTAHTGVEDVFVFKFNLTTLSFIYSTYVGGSGEELAENIAVDSLGNAYVTGYTYSSDFPTTLGAYDNTYNGSMDAFCFKLNTQGSSLLFSTYIGENSEDYAYGIAVDNYNNPTITGYTWSVKFPVTPNAYDTIYNSVAEVFVTKLNATGMSLIFSTFIGGGGIEHGKSIKVDSKGDLYICGQTYSPDFPTTPGAYDTQQSGMGIDDVFVCKLSATGSNLIYSTFIKGNSYDYGESIAIDEYNNAYITGRSISTTYPTTPNANNSNNSGSYDVIISKLHLEPNFPPYVLNLNISKSSVTRTKIVLLYLNATDDLDSENNLTPYFEFRDQINKIWNTTYFSKSQYNNSRWEVHFSPFKDAFLGKYDFRVRVNDSTQFFSPWYYLNNSLFVLNNIPIIENILLSNNSGILGDKTDIWINVSDTEEIEQNLTVEIEYRDSSETLWNKTHLSSPLYNNGRWECIFNIPFDALFGYYDLKVRCNDSDGNFSNWFYLNDSFEVYNTKPNLIDLKLSASSIYRTGSVLIYINGTDFETPANMLSFHIQYKPQTEVDWTDLTGNYLNNRWEASLVSNEVSTLGFYDFRVKFDDNETATTGWIYLNGSLEVLNNIPYVQDINLSKMNVYRTDSIIISVNCSDVEDNEDVLDCEIQVKSLSNDWTSLGNVIYNLDHWESVFTPNEDAELGSYEVRINFTDLDGGYSDWVISSWIFSVLNNLPSISNDLDDIEVGIQALIIDLTPYESDIEDSGANLTWSIDSQIYTYIESIGIIDLVNDTLKITPKENVTGSEDIELTLTDKDSGSAIKSDITINIDSTISDNTPKVTLLSPVDKAVINTLTPILKWELDYSGTDIITYAVALDENPDPKTTIIAGLTTTEYTLENELVDGNTYYWKVEPTNGICLSGAFRFTIDLGFEPIYKVNLTAETESVTIKQAASDDITLTVTNEGNSIDNFKIELSSSNLLTYISIDKNNVQLNPEVYSTLTLVIDIPNDFSIGDYSIIVSATSLTDLTVKDEVTIDVKVVSKDFMPDYDVSITLSQTSFEINQGDSENVTITITNIGNIEDDFTITFESDDFTSANIQLSKNFLTLPDGDSDTVTVMIKIPDAMEPGVYTIKFIVESNDDPQESTLTVTVKDKDGEEPGDKKDEADNTMLYSLIGIIVIIIVVLILLFIFLKKKKGKEGLPVEEAQPPPVEEVPPEQAPVMETPPSEQPSTPEVLPEQVPTPEAPIPEQPTEIPPEQQSTPEVPHEQQPIPEVSPQVPPQVEPVAEQAPMPQVEEPP
jgi:hypothetical protein